MGTHLTATIRGVTLWGNQGEQPQGIAGLFDVGVLFTKHPQAFSLSLSD